MTLETWIERANKVRRTYGYEKSVYTGSSEKITIRCKTHGYFDQIAGNHISGNGCSKCCKGKSEELCRQIIEENTGYKFPSVTPNFLRWKTRNLELDGYCEELK